MEEHRITLPRLFPYRVEYAIEYPRCSSLDRAEQWFEDNGLQNITDYIYWRSSFCFKDEEMATMFKLSVIN